MTGLSIRKLRVSSERWPGEETTGTGSFKFAVQLMARSPTVRTTQSVHRLKGTSS
jgi:hypothetical protein